LQADIIKIIRPGQETAPAVFLLHPKFLEKDIATGIPFDIVRVQF
jgi:hypothetical protein